MERRPVAISPRLSRKLTQVLGEEAEELVTKMDHLDGQRDAMDAAIAGIRQEIAAFRLDVAQQIGALREEMRVGFASLRQEMALMEARFERRFSDLIKWSFVFWVGAVAAVAMLARALR